MSFVKYSLGGKITSVQDADGVEEREVGGIEREISTVLVCKKCGIQHALMAGESDRKCSCGGGSIGVGSSC